MESAGWSREVGVDAAGARAVRQGIADVSLGAKWHMQDTDGATPAVAWLLHLDTPSGASAVRGNGLRPSLRSVINWNLPQDFSLSLMPGLRYGADDAGQRYLSAVFGAVLSKWWTPHWRTFVEFGGEQLARAPRGNLVNLNLGTAWVLTPDTQVGARLLAGASRLAPNYTLLLALAQRF
jgi:hypothetical protein